MVALAANLTVFTLLYPKTVSFEPLPGWTDAVMNGVVGPAFLVIAIFHLVALVTLGWQIKVLQRGTALRALVAGLGVISLLLVAGNFPLLGDIGKQHRVGLESASEWRMVFMNQGVHLLFIVAAGWCIGYTNKILLAGGREREPAARDEAVFLTALHIGVLSGALGLGMISMILLTGVPARFVGRAARGGLDRGAALRGGGAALPAHRGRRNWAQTIPAATAALSESAAPWRGIVTRRVTRWRTAGERPPPSPPTTTTASPTGGRECTSSPVRSQPRMGVAEAQAARAAASSAVWTRTRANEPMLALITFW